MRCLFLISVLLVTCLLVASAPAWAAIEAFKQPNAYAVVIGISQYSEEVIPKVPYAVKDAQAVAIMLETQAGIPKTHIKLLADSKATLSGLRNHLGDWLRMRVKPDSTVYVYYAGHGTPNLQTQSGSIVPWDGHPDFPSGLYPLKELEDTLGKLQTKDVVVFLDSCFSGSVGRSVLAKGARPMVLQYPVLSAGEVMVLAAATGTQISSDYDKAEHGLFTHYLLTGLQGEADADKDQVVTLRELVPYVKERVAHTAVEELNREQTPVLLPGEQVLGKRVTLVLAHTASVSQRQDIEAKEREKRDAEERAKLEAERRQLEEERKRLAEERRQAEERAKLEAERRGFEEERRRLAEERARAEDERRGMAEEQARRERESRATQEARVRSSLEGTVWITSKDSAGGYNRITFERGGVVRMESNFMGGTYTEEKWRQDGNSVSIAYTTGINYRGTIMGNRIEGTFITQRGAVRPGPTFFREK